MNWKKLFKRLLVFALIVPILLFSSTVLLLYWKQKEVVQELITTLNKDFKGEITLSYSDISPFESFPYVSIDLHDLKVYETKNRQVKPIVDIGFVYLGFSVSDLLTGKVLIKSIKLKEGHIDAIQYKNNEFNIINAFSSDKPASKTEEDLHLSIKEIYFENIDITKLNERNALKIET